MSSTRRPGPPRHRGREDEEKGDRQSADRDAPRFLDLGVDGGEGKWPVADAEREQCRDADNREQPEVRRLRGRNQAATHSRPSGTIPAAQIAASSIVPKTKVDALFAASVKAPKPSTATKAVQNTISQVATRHRVPKRCRSRSGSSSTSVLGGGLVGVRVGRPSVIAAAYPGLVVPGSA
jgi:hypothetical protein